MEKRTEYFQVNNPTYNSFMTITIVLWVSLFIRSSSTKSYICVCVSYMLHLSHITGCQKTHFGFSLPFSFLWPPLLRLFSLILMAKLLSTISKHKSCGIASSSCNCFTVHCCRAKHQKKRTKILLLRKSLLPKMGPSQIVCLFNFIICIQII